VVGCFLSFLLVLTSLRYWPESVVGYLKLLFLPGSVVLYLFLSCLPETYFVLLLQMCLLFLSWPGIFFMPGALFLTCSLGLLSFFWVFRLLLVLVVLLSAFEALYLALLFFIFVFFLNLSLFTFSSVCCSLLVSVDFYLCLLFFIGFC